MRIILASSSPRRREIFALLGLPFEVIAPRFGEVPLPGRSLRDEVLEFAVGKAESTVGDNPRSMIIGSDTMILLDATKIGKPDNLLHAKQILRALSGKTHRIFTAVAILDDLGGPGLRSVEEVSVKMRDYSEEDIERYLASNESLDKAGAYSIQGEGRALIESLRGDYLAAVGLPLKPLADYFSRHDVEVPLDVEKLYRDKDFLNWRTF